MKRLRQSISFKSISGIVLLLVLFSLIVSMIGYNGFTDALLNQYSEGAFHTARIAAAIIEADRIDEYSRSSGETEAYQAAWTSLRRLCNSANATFVYVIQPDRTDYKHITFLFSTINRHSTYSLYDFGFVRETTNEEYAEKYRAICEGGSQQELVIRDKGYIETDPHITAMIPLTASDGTVKAIMCVQMQMDVMLEARNTYLIKVSIAFAALALIVIIVLSTALNKQILKPIRKISEEATRFSKENVPASRKLQERVRSRDEIGELAVSIDDMEEQIQRNVENLTRITAEKERIGAEMALATRIQAAMLPHVFPPFPDRQETRIYRRALPATSAACSTS